MKAFTLSFDTYQTFIYGQVIFELDGKYEISAIRFETDFRFHDFGPLYLIVSNPLFTFLTLGKIQSWPFLFAGIKISFIDLEHKSCLTLYISFANFCQFLS